MAADQRYSPFANSEYLIDLPMELKPQDLLKVAAHPAQRWTYAALGEAPVWAYPDGKAKGPTLSPLYRTAAQAALADPALLEAFGGRGEGDFLTSHDLEDVLNIVDGRGELANEMAAAPAELKQAIEG